MKFNEYLKGLYAVLPALVGVRVLAGGVMLGFAVMAGSSWASPSVKSSSASAVAAKKAGAQAKPSTAKKAGPVAKQGASKKLGARAKQIAAKPNAKRSVKVAKNKAGRVPLKAVARAAPSRLSYGALAGLHSTDDPLDLRSSVALVMDEETREVLLRKNDLAVLPIASLTKLMTGLLVSEAKLPLYESVTITAEDVDTEKGSGSRLKVGTTLTRGELVQLAVMSSENRAAHALGRTYPGGLDTFVALMNSRAQALGMTNTRYVEPTGLSSRNQSSAQDLALLVSKASRDPLISELSTAKGYMPIVGNRHLQFNNTNALVKDPDWDIGVQKTGYISEAGRCLVMQAKVAGRKIIMVFLDSTGRLSRVADAQRVKRWVEAKALLHPLQTTAPVAGLAGRG